MKALQCPFSRATCNKLYFQGWHGKDAGDILEREAVGSALQPPKGSLIAKYPSVIP